MCGSAEDVGLPFMTDPRHTDDTLFIVFEQDFRFYEDDDLPVDVWLRLATGPTVKWTPRLPDGPAQLASRTPPAGQASSSSSGAAAPHVKVTRSADIPPREPKWDPALNTGRAKKALRPQGAVRPCVAPELLDIVLTANLAARDGHGDLIWMGWNCSDENQKVKQPWHIGFGSQLICYTPRGARQILALTEKEKPMHWDLWLKWHLTNNAGSLANGDCRASYVYPPLGSFAMHKSNNLKGGERKGLWSLDWCTEGSVRMKQKSGEARVLGRFLTGSRTPLSVIRHLDFDDADLSWLWKTQMPPSVHDSRPLAMIQLLEKLGWGDDWRYWGPPFTKAEWEQWEKNNLHWEDINLGMMRRVPDEPDASGYDAVHSASKQPGRLGVRLGSMPTDSDPLPTKRSDRNRRIAQALYKRRFFVDSALEVDERKRNYFGSMTNLISRDRAVRLSLQCCF